MRFKDEFLKELLRRIKENIEIINSSFELSDIELKKSKLINLEPLEFHLPILIESDPYLFLNKLTFAVINRQNIKVTTSNLACDLLLELINLILAEFGIERIEKI